MSEYPPLIVPNLRAPAPVAVRGRGVWLYDEDGREYLDGCSGAVVSNLGHGLPEMAEVLVQQAATLEFVHRSQFSTRPAQELAARVAAWAPGDLDHSFFVNSGSEATELAIKLVRQYWAERGRPAKRELISRWSSYHGTTMGALSLSGNVGRRRTMAGAVAAYPAVPRPHCYFCPVEKEYPACGLYCARELEQAILRVGPENVAAFVAEPVVGASGGAIVPPDGYYQVVREICDRYEILLVADEVMTGFGRTGRSFGMDHWGVVPDVMVLGKGLSAGYFPMAGITVRTPVYQAIAQGSGRFSHGHTLSASPLGCAVALRALTYLEEHGLVERAAALGRVLMQELERLTARHPLVGEVRGKGLLLGLELVAQRQPARPFDFAADAAGRLTQAAFAAGLMLYPSRGALDGAAGDAVIVAPPLTISDGEAEEMVARLDTALTRWEGDMAPWQT